MSLEISQKSMCRFLKIFRIIVRTNKLTTLYPLVREWIFRFTLVTLYSTMRCTTPSRTRG